MSERITKMLLDLAAKLIEQHGDEIKAKILELLWNWINPKQDVPVVSAGENDPIAVEFNSQAAEIVASEGE